MHQEPIHILLKRRYREVETRSYKIHSKHKNKLETRDVSGKKDGI